MDFKGGCLLSFKLGVVCVCLCKSTLSLCTLCDYISHVYQCVYVASLCFRCVEFQCSQLLLSCYEDKLRPKAAPSLPPWLHAFKVYAV